MSIVYTSAEQRFRDSWESELIKSGLMSLIAEMQARISKLEAQHGIPASPPVARKRGKKRLRYSH